MRNLIIIFISLSVAMVLYLLGLYIKRLMWRSIYKSFRRITSERYNGYDKYVVQSMSSNSRLYKAKKLYMAFEDDTIVLLRNEGSNQKYACEFSKQNIQKISCSSYGMNVYIEIQHNVAGLVSPYKAEIFSRHIEDIEDAVSRMSASLKNIKR